MTVSALISTETQALQAQTWDLAALFTHNWIKDFTIRTSWLTDLTSARSDSEKRLSLVNKPYRTITVSPSVTNDRRQMRLIDSVMARMGSARSLWPIYCDQSLVTGISATEIFCETAYRRFFAGSRVIIADLTSDILCPNQVALKILTVSSDRLTLDAGEAIPSWVAAALPKKTVYALPCLECEVDLGSELSLITNRTGQSDLVASEVVGRTALPASIAPNALPAGFQSYNGLPILEVSGDWGAVKIGRARSGSRSNLGIGFTFELFGSRPRATAKARFWMDTRAASWSLLQLFDSRRGRMLPFWMVRPEDSIKLNSITSTTVVRVDSHGPLLDWNFYPAVYFKKQDGTLIVRTITSVSRSGTEDILTFSDPLPSFVVSDIDACGLAAQARFSSDEIIENWTTENIVTVQFDVVELLQEKTVTITSI